MRDRRHHHLSFFRSWSVVVILLFGNDDTAEGLNTARFGGTHRSFPPPKSVVSKRERRDRSM